MIALGWLVFGPAIFVWFRNIAAIDFWSEGNILKTERNFMEISDFPMSCDICGSSVRPQELKLSESKALLVFGSCSNCNSRQNGIFSLVDLLMKCPGDRLGVEDILEEVMSKCLSEEDKNFMREMKVSVEDEEG